MVLVPVRQKQTFNLFFVFLEIGGIRDHQIDPQHIFIGKSQAAIDDDDGVFVLKNSHVLPDFTDSAQGYDLQFAKLQSGIFPSCLWHN